MCHYKIKENNIQMPERENERGVSRMSPITDCFADPFSFKLPNGADNYRTYLGSFMSILMVLILILYGML